MFFGCTTILLYTFLLPLLLLAVKQIVVEICGKHEKKTHCLIQLHKNLDLNRIEWVELLAKHTHAVGNRCALIFNQQWTCQQTHQISYRIMCSFSWVARLGSLPQYASRINHINLHKFSICWNHIFLLVFVISSFTLFSSSFFLFYAHLVWNKKVLVPHKKWNLKVFWICFWAWLENTIGCPM